MRSVKTTGGMVRKKGMPELQRAQWFQSIPACSSIHTDMQDFKKLQYCRSDLHKESSKFRQVRDNTNVTPFLTLCLAGPHLSSVQLIY